MAAHSTTSHAAPSRLHALEAAADAVLRAACALQLQYRDPPTVLYAVDLVPLQQAIDQLAAALADPPEPAA